MPVYSVPDVGTIGVITDVEPVLLPPGAWTEIRNVRFVDNSAVKFLGQQVVGTPEVTPYYLQPVTVDGTGFWVYCGLEAVYAWDGSASHVDITRLDTGSPDPYTGTAVDYWNGGSFNGVLVLNNGVDDPQMLVSTNLESLTWDSGNTWAAKGYTCKALRPYRNFLIAMDWDDGTSRYPYQVYWSNRADPLSVPSDWDYADPANEAGILDLATTDGYIVTGEQLRDSFIVYKEDAMHVMTEVGGTFVMEFRDLSLTTGMLAQRCAKEFYGRHFVLANDDVIVHDGQTIESLASKRVRRSIFRAIDTTYFNNAFVVRNLARHEMWCCFTEQGSTVPNRAAVWNWRDNTWAHRDLPALNHAGFGVLPATTATDVTTWNSDSQAWDADTSTWAARLFNPAAVFLIGASSSDLLVMDTTAQFAGVNIDSYVLREDILVDGDQSTLKMVRAIYPRALGSALQVSIGSKFDVRDSYAWEGPYSFAPGTDSKVRVRSTGRFHAIKFQFPGGSDGSLQGYDLEYVPVGNR